MLPLTIKNNNGRLKNAFSPNHTTSVWEALPSKRHVYHVDCSSYPFLVKPIYAENFLNIVRYYTLLLENHIQLYVKGQFIVALNLQYIMVAGGQRLWGKQFCLSDIQKSRASRSISKYRCVGSTRQPWK
jgi:hypothetical protein